MKAKKSKERYYTITMNEHQFVLMINCIEDISRFMAGQTELFHTILNLPNYLEVKDKMEKIAHLICHITQVMDGQGVVALMKCRQNLLQRHTIFIERCCINIHWPIISIMFIHPLRYAVRIVVSQ